MKKQGGAKQLALAACLLGFCGVCSSQPTGKRLVLVEDGVSKAPIVVSKEYPSPNNGNSQGGAVSISPAMSSPPSLGAVAEYL